jgi:hypothetical protein
MMRWSETGFAKRGAAAGLRHGFPGQAVLTPGNVQSRQAFFGLRGVLTCRPTTNVVRALMYSDLKLYIDGQGLNGEGRKAFMEKRKPQFTGSSLRLYAHSRYLYDNCIQPELGTGAGHANP